MPTTDLTALATIGMFDEPLRTALADYWITSAEEFVSTARSGNRTYGSGLAALGKALNLEEQRVRELVQHAQAALPPGTAFDVGVELEVGTGAIFEGMEAPPPTHFALTLELPDMVNLAADLPPPQQQGKRNTCVAFTLAAMYQHASGDPADLSEQFLYWACKERDGIPQVKGTRPDTALAALRDQGVCAEPTWPYEPQQTTDEGQGPPPDGAAEEARRHRITGFSSLPPRDVRQIQAALAEGKPVLLGLPINEHWTGAWQARTLGRVRRPLPGEASLGGHAMCAVGYRNDPGVPGGGYFIVRNSWGTTWGTDNPDGAGYCHVPYRIVHESNLAAFMIDGIVPDAAPTPSDQAAAFSAEVTADSALATSDLQSLYDEARDIQQRLNALVERLATLLPGNRTDDT